MFPEIITILVGKRKESAMKVQEVLTEFGCIIQTRIGLHETVDETCTDCGLIILQVKGGKKDVESMIKKLNRIKQVNAKNLELSFDD